MQSGWKQQSTSGRLITRRDMVFRAAHAPCADILLVSKGEVVDFHTQVHVKKNGCQSK